MSPYRTRAGRWLLLASLLFPAAVWAALRTWTSVSGAQVEAEFVERQGTRVVLRRADGVRLSIEAHQLSAADRAFVEGGAAPLPGAPAQAPAAGETDFLRVIERSCVRCHKNACQSLDTLLSHRWVRPGDPDRSPVYTVIGTHKKPDGKYHELPDAERKLIRDFIAGLKPAAAAAGTGSDAVRR